MFCFSLRRKKGRRGDSPESMDRRIFPQRSPGAAGPPQPDPEEFSRLCLHRQPGNGCAELRSHDGIQLYPGSGNSGRNSGISGEARAGHGCAHGDGKEPGSRRNARAQQEKVTVEKVPSGIQPLGKGFGDEPGVPRPARNGNVPREGTEQPRPPLQAGSSENEEGESSGSSPSRDTHGAARREPEPRERIWEKLRRLGEAMERWEGKPTAALAARLAQRIAETPTPSYPTGPGTPRAPREPRSGAGPEPADPAGNEGIFAGMLRVCGNAESGEEDEEESDWERDSERSDWEEEQDWEEKEQDWEEEEQDWEEEEQDWEEEEQDWDQEQNWDQEQDWDQAVRIMYLSQSPFSRALQEEFPAVWARSSLDCGLLAHEERLDGDPVPFQSQRRLSPGKEARMAELLQEYLREGIVVEGASASNNPLMLQQKPKGRGWRLGLDGRALNAATPAGPPQERLDKAAILGSVHPRSRFFSVLDLCGASLAIPLARSSWPRFAFTFRGRQFQFTRLPPGFRDTGSILHRRVAAALAPLLRPEPGSAPGAFHYYDDILITGKSRRQAESRTRRALELIQSAGFKANPAKAQLVQRRVDYLGLTLGAEGRGVSEETLREIGQACDAPGPWNPRRLRSVLHKLEARQEFIPDFWELALPLHRLAERGQREWRWTREHRERLRRLREALEAATPLPFPQRSRPFLIRLRVRAETAGAELLQDRAGTELPVGRCSLRLRGRRLSPWDAWLQAAVRAVRAFRALTGPTPVAVLDPNGNYLLRGHAFVTGGARLAEPWTLLVSAGSPEPPESRGVIAIPPAPPLRELPAHIPRANVWFLALEKGVAPCSSVGFAAANLEERGMTGVSGKGSEEDAELEALREILERHRSRFPLFLYCNRPGLAARLERRERERGWNSCGDAGPVVLRWLRAFPGMLRLRELGAAGPAEPRERERLEQLSGSVLFLGCLTTSSWILWDPSRAERQEIVARCHQSRHEGVEQTLARVREVGFWRSDGREEVTRWVRSCPTCSRSDPDPAPQRAEGPWSRLRIGLSGALPNTPEGFRALLVVQDELSGWLDAFPLRQREQPEVSRALLRDVFAPLGKVSSVLPAPEPAWLRLCLEEAPLRSFWSRLELSEQPEAVLAVSRAARAAGRGWAEALPLILAGARSRWLREEELSPLLCVPGLPLEVRWDWPAPQAGPGPGELSRLRGMRLLPGYRDWVEAALRAQPGSEPATRGVRDLGTPDPGSQYARPGLTIRWIRDWERLDHKLGAPGAANGTGWTQALPLGAEGLRLNQGGSRRELGEA